MRTFTQHLNERKMEADDLKNRLLKSEFKTYDEMEDWFHHNSVFVGEGAYGQVYKSKNGNQYVARLSQAWGAYEDYAKRVRTKSNSLTPKIHFMYELDDMSVVTVVEYLEIRENPQIARHFRNLYRSYRDGKDPSDRSVGFVQNLYVDFDDLNEVFDIMISIIGEYDGKDDIRDMNVGFRPDGSLVIFDPLR